MTLGNVQGDQTLQIPIKTQGNHIANLPKTTPRLSFVGLPCCDRSSGLSVVRLSSVELWSDDAWMVEVCVKTLKRRFCVRRGGVVIPYRKDSAL